MQQSEDKKGVVLALIAFTVWGLAPIYFKALQRVSPLEVVARRILWSVPITAFLVFLGRGWEGEQILTDRQG